MKNKVLIAAVIAAALSMASCGQINTLTEVTAAPAETTLQELVPEDTQQETEETAVTTAVPDSTASGTASDDSAEVLKNTTITADTPLPITTKAPSVPASDNGQTQTAENELTAEELDRLNGEADNATFMANTYEMFMKGFKTDNHEVMYDENFERTDDPDAAVYYPVAIEGAAFRFTSKAQAEERMSYTFTDRFFNSRGYRDCMDNAVVEHDGALYYKILLIRDDYTEMQRVDDNVKVIDENTFTFTVHSTSFLGCDYFNSTVTMVKNGDTYRIDSITAAE